MNDIDYWKECISLGADECGLLLTEQQLVCLAESAQGGHDHYSLAFYSPPPSDRIAEVEREWKAKLKLAQQELERYRNNAEIAIKKALQQRSDAHISIGEHGEVVRYDGRTTIIQ